MTPAFNSLRIIGLLVLAMLLTACSSLKLGYNSLPDVAYWWLDGYVDFSEAQTPRVREDLARLQMWHRRAELPRYAQLLQRLEQLAPVDVTASQVCAVATEIAERLTAIGDQAEPAVVTLALGLSPAQLAQLDKKYQKNNAQYRREWLALSPVELHNKRYQLLVERSEQFYNRLDEAQRAALRSQVERSVFDARLVLAERQRRQQDALVTLKKLAGRPMALAEARALVHAYLHRVQTSPDPVNRRYQEALIQESCQTIAALHNSTNAVQRESAGRRLRSYQQDLRDLSAPG